MRVTYVNNIAASIAVPAVFGGDLAAINAADYVKKLMVIPPNKDISNRTEYHVLPAAHRDSVCGPVQLGHSDKDTEMKAEDRSGVHRRFTVAVRRLG